MTNGIANVINNDMNGITNDINGIGIGYRLEAVSGFKFPLENEFRNFPISKDEEIYLERMPYLTNTDDLLEELLRKKS